MEDTITVTNGDTTEECTIEDTFTHGHSKVHKVNGDTLFGFVEVSDESPSQVGDW